MKKRRLNITEASKSALDTPESSKSLVVAQLKGSQSGNETERNETAQSVMNNVAQGSTTRILSPKLRAKSKISVFKDKIPKLSKDASMFSAQNLPSVVNDDNSYRLMDLVQSDFKMSETDSDFELTHEQLIKVVKILLYRQNLNSKKSSYERVVLSGIMNDRVNKIEEVTKSSLDEVNTFLHTVHADFEQFLIKHKKEHVEVNMKILQNTELLHQVSSLVSKIKLSAEK